MNKVTVLDRDVYIEQLQSIHGLRDALGLSNEDYRNLLYKLTGSQSAKYMTPEQRSHVITFMRVHKALDDAIELAEDARETLNASYETQKPSIMEKVILLDGKHEASMHASLEEVIETMRAVHGPDVRLAGATEQRIDDSTVLELSFERPAVYLLAS